MLIFYKIRYLYSFVILILIMSILYNDCIYLDFGRLSQGNFASESKFSYARSLIFLMGYMERAKF